MIRGYFCGVSRYRNNTDLDFCLNDPLSLANAFTQNIVMNYESIVFPTSNGEIDNIDFF